MQDYTAATALLESLVTHTHTHAQKQERQGAGAGATSSELRSALGRVYLQAGQLDQAKRHFEVVGATLGATTDKDDDDDDAKVVVVPESTKALNAAFMASACGEWETAGTILRGLVDSLAEWEGEASSTQKDDSNNNNTYYAVSSLFLFYFIF